MPCINDLTALIKDVVVTGVSGFGAYIAWRGLSTWQRQIAGQSSFTLARNLLIGLFKYREAVRNVRNQFMWPEEVALTEEERIGKTSDEISFLGSVKGYNARWKNLREVRATVYADLIESEALWGKDLSQLFLPLFELQSELELDTTYYLKTLNPDLSKHTRDSLEKIRSARRNSLFAPIPADDTKDAFNTDFLIKTSVVEQYLRSKLPAL